MGRLTVEKAAVPRVTGKTETDYTYREISGGTVETNYTYSISVRQQSTEQGYRPYEPVPHEYEGDDVKDHMYGESSGETRFIVDFNVVVTHPEDVLGNVYEQVARIELVYGGDGGVAVSSHWDSSAEDFPDPDTPAIVTKECIGISRLTFLRLLTCIFFKIIFLELIPILLSKLYAFPANICPVKVPLFTSL